MKSNEKIAIALKYPENCQAPFIVAKAKGNLAENVINEAIKNKIPVRELPETAEILEIADVGSFVPEETWTCLAKVFAVLLKEDFSNE